MAVARLLRKLVPTYQITRCHNSGHNKNQTYIRSKHIGYICAAKTAVDPVHCRAWLLNRTVNHTNFCNIQNSAQSSQFPSKADSIRLKYRFSETYTRGKKKELGIKIDMKIT